MRNVFFFLLFFLFIGILKRKAQPLVISDDEDVPIIKSIRSNPAQDFLKNQITKLRVELDLVVRRKGSLVADGTENEKILNLQRDPKLIITRLIKTKTFVWHP